MKQNAIAFAPGTVVVPKKKRRYATATVYYVVGVLLSLLFLAPVLYMIAASTKSDDTLAHQAGSLLMFLPSFDFSAIGQNYGAVFGEGGIFKNGLLTLGYAAIVIVLNVLVNGLAAYAITKLHFPGKGLLRFFILFLIVVPIETSIIPLYTICYQALGLRGGASVLSFILPSSISIFNVFLFMQFFSSIPSSYEEAARIDGASTLSIFFRIIVPLSKPIIATVAVFCFIGVWNDYLWPSMVLPDSYQPIQSALNGFQSRDLPTGAKMASLVITSLPIFCLYVGAQKYIVKGFGAGGLKL
ncbi:MAG: carbohydrate ABC transporter permease [Candidatus Enteromonas sp.]